MFGHPSENLFWAPDPRGDLAFTLYATSIEEHNMLMDKIREEFPPEPHSMDMRDFMIAVQDTFPESENLDWSDWEKLYQHYYCY